MRELTRSPSRARADAVETKLACIQIFALAIQSDYIHFDTSVRTQAPCSSPCALPPPRCPLIQHTSSRNRDEKGVVCRASYTERIIEYATLIRKQCISTTKDGMTQKGSYRNSPPTSFELDKHLMRHHWRGASLTDGPMRLVQLDLGL